MRETEKDECGRQDPGNSASHILLFAILFKRTALFAILVSHNTFALTHPFPANFERQTGQAQGKETPRAPHVGSHQDPKPPSGKKSKRGSQRQTPRGLGTGRNTGRGDHPAGRTKPPCTQESHSEAKEERHEGCHTDSGCAAEPTGAEGGGREEADKEGDRGGHQDTERPAGQRREAALSAPERRGTEGNGRSGGYQDSVGGKTETGKKCGGRKSARATGEAGRGSGNQDPVNTERQTGEEGARKREGRKKKAIVAGRRGGTEAEEESSKKKETNLRTLLERGKEGLFFLSRLFVLSFLASLLSSLLFLVYSLPTS